MSQNQNYDPLKLDDNVIVPKTSLSSKSKSKKNKNKFQYQSFDNITKTAPSNRLNDMNVNNSSPIKSETESAKLLSIDNEDKYDHREDASALAFPINPFDHLMPHRNDCGTPNMAYIGEDGLIHTPHGGAYAQTTEAVANFRRALKYDDSWHRTRQRYICLILLIMALTFIAVIILLITRKVNIINVQFRDNINNDVWQLGTNCPSQFENVSNGCNVTINANLDIKINNHNWVPATINLWKIQHYFLCVNMQNGCTPSGASPSATEIGEEIQIQDGVTEINRKNAGVAILDDISRFKLSECHTLPYPNDTFCEWQRSCLNYSGNNDYIAPGLFILIMDIKAELSFALQSAKEISTTINMGVYCNGTAVICNTTADSMCG